MDSQVAVTCISCKRSSRSEILLAISQSFQFCTLPMPPSHGTIHNGQTECVGRHPIPVHQIFSGVAPSYMSVSLPDHLVQLPRDQSHHGSGFSSSFPVLTLYCHMEAEDPDTFTMPWNHPYLCLPPETSVLLQVCEHLQSSSGRVLLIAPQWEAQL